MIAPNTLKFRYNGKKGPQSHHTTSKRVYVNYPQTPLCGDHLQYLPFRSPSYAIARVAARQSVSFQTRNTILSSCNNVLSKTVKTNNKARHFSGMATGRFNGKSSVCLARSPSSSAYSSC